MSFPVALPGVKAKRKRRKPPGFWFWWWAFWSAFAYFFAVWGAIDVMNGEMWGMFSVAVQLFFAHGPWPWGYVRYFMVEYRKWRDGEDE